MKQRMHGQLSMPSLKKLKENPSMRKPINVILICFTLMMFAMPVSANAPTRSDGLVDEVIVLGDCGDFLILDHGVWEYTVTTYTDAQGVPIREAVKGRGSDEVYSSIRPDRIVSGHIIFNAQFDLTADGLASSGQFWHIIAPGQGNLFIQVGRHMNVNGELVFSAGPRSDIDALCAYFRQ